MRVRLRTSLVLAMAVIIAVVVVAPASAASGGTFRIADPSGSDVWRCVEIGGGELLCVYVEGPNDGFGNDYIVTRSAFANPDGSPRWIVSIPGSGLAPSPGTEAGREKLDRVFNPEDYGNPLNASVAAIPAPAVGTFPSSPSFGGGRQRELPDGWRTLRRRDLRQC